LKVLVTGSTGFVGRYLCPLLRHRDETVFGTSYPDRPAASDKKTFFLDLRLKRDVFRLIKKVRPERVFHLAAVSNVRHSWLEREETFETNLMGTFYLFEAIRQHSPEARILFVSSSDVYGVVGPSVRELKEDHPSQAVNPYSYTKLAGEILARFYVQVENLDVVIARPFPHTGPGQSPDFVCSDWARQIARIEKGLAAPVIKVGNLRAERDFSDVRDIVRAYLLLVQRGRKGEVYNVCSGKSNSLEKILGRLLALSSRTISIEVDTKKLRKVDLPRLLGSNHKIKEETGWAPKIPITRTLIDLLESWREK
jgi:GDP-4-dehydro-6-deoxy-D-mannose reductase